MHHLWYKTDPQSVADGDGESVPVADGVGERRESYNHCNNDVDTAKHTFTLIECPVWDGGTQQGIS